MKIVLKKAQKNLGKKGEVVEVRPGYARNFLFPQNLAWPASQGNIKSMEKVIVQEKDKEREVFAKLAKMQKQISGLRVKIQAQADAMGKLYGSVGKREIQDVLAPKIGLHIPKQKIELRKPIKEIGDYEIRLLLSAKIKTKIHLEVVAQKSRPK